MVLDHTNAFYVRRDDRPRIGPDADKPFIVGEVCIHDSTVRSEVNARLEMLRGALMDEGIHVDELRIVTSTWGMKKRHPFANRGPAPAADTVQSRGREVAGAGPSGLQVVKRAFCLVFGEAAESVLSQVGIATLDEVPREQGDIAMRQVPWYRCDLYSADGSFPQLMEAYEGALVSAARTLGLNLSWLRGHCRAEAAGIRAFPVAGYPLASDAADRGKGVGHEG